MRALPLANILQHKLRSLLTAAGIAVSVCMLITLSSLARGSLFEIADRWESIDADLMLLPRGLRGDSATVAGSQLPDGLADVITARHSDIVEYVVPVFLWQLQLAGQDHMAAGVDAGHWYVLSGRAKVNGRLYDPDGRFARWLDEQILAAPDEGALLDISADQLGDPDHNGLELVIDSRLAGAGRYRLGQTVNTAGYDWTIVGIVPAGGMTRIYMPRRTAQYLAGSGNITRSTLMFIKLIPGVDRGPAARQIAESTRADAVPVADHRDKLTSKFRMMFVYVDTVNVIAMGIAFLFIMVMLYAMVLQRTRDIAILKANGASNAFLLRQVMAESMIITAIGTAGGIVGSFLAAWAIQVFRPLLTVQITIRWIVIAVAIATVGAAASALYPAWRATRVDMVEALTLE